MLVYFAVAKLGDAPTDGKTDVNPEGRTAAYGPHAAAVAARLHAAGLSCKARAVVGACQRRQDRCCCGVAAAEQGWLASHLCELQLPARPLCSFSWSC